MEDELLLAKLKKLAQMQRKIAAVREEEEKRKSREQLRRKLIASMTTRDGVEKLEALRSSSPELARKIEDVMLEIGRSYGFRVLFDRYAIEAIRRKLVGEETRIRIQKDGRTIDFSEYIRGST
ncbi:MAG: hypothetical protein DRN96_03490 [Thermoproteota archaeon]|nr:MAG: hypothetical protein DRN96_03490 [Candidatus Korarchaeota archaeon]RLG56083.1 MAG: hypothetical protein DRN99_00625 [Candidatus Korarchaeota archaeon]